MLNWLRRLVRVRDPFDKPCQCGRQTTIFLSDEREDLALEDSKAYCPSCIAPIMRQALAEARGRWLVVQPFAGILCYVPYTIDELADFDEFAAWPGDVRAILDKASPACSRCDASADRFAWVPTRDEQTLDDLQNSPTWFRDREAVALCESCLAAALLDSLRERGIKVYELVFPTAGPGVWLPWGY